MNLENQINTRKPPVATTGLIGWLRVNLFSSWFNTDNSLVFRLVNF